MASKVRKIVIPTPAEDAEINVQIAEDPEDFEADAEWFKEAKPSAEIIPHILVRYNRTRGKQKSPTKERVNIRLDAEILAYYRATGSGWQTRLNDDLRRVTLG